MYMRNNKNNNKYAKYNIDGFPPNYSGQYTVESPREDYIPEVPPISHNNNEKKELKEEKNESILSNLFRSNKDGGKGGILSGLFNKDKKDNKDGGFLSNIEIEDLILIAVIFFLLKDGLEDDLILILAIILFSS